MDKLKVLITGVLPEHAEILMKEYGERAELSIILDKLNKLKAKMRKCDVFIISKLMSHDATHMAQRINKTRKVEMKIFPPSQARSLTDIRTLLDSLLNEKEIVGDDNFCFCGSSMHETHYKSLPLHMCSNPKCENVMMSMRVLKQAMKLE